ncbi:MAG: hypothetical protein HYT10_01745 [Candidatus Levybacteria bacterium]|nr:hypothetical protein [Candidatus Levybacteria bacterium]
MDDAQNKSAVGQLPSAPSSVSSQTPPPGPGVSSLSQQPSGPVEQQTSATVSQPTSSSPVGGFNKEQAPIVYPFETGEVITASEKEPVLHPEIQEAGVEVSRNPEIPDLTIHDKNAGIKHSGDILPVNTAPTGAVQLPMTEEEANSVLKKGKNPKKSLTWLAIAVIRQMKIMHRKLLGGQNG